MNIIFTYLLYTSKVVPPFFPLPRAKLHARKLAGTRNFCVQLKQAKGRETWQCGLALSLVR